MKVKFVPQNVEFEIKPGESVMHVAQDHGLYIKSVCKGVPSCAECRVRVVEGEHNVLPPGSEELSLIGTGHFIDRRRLSCQLKCFGDITVDMTEQLEKQATGGKKSRRQPIKDDRVEQAVAIRSDSYDEDSDSVSATAASESGAQTTQRPPQKSSQRPSQRSSPREPARDGKPKSHSQGKRPPQAQGAVEGRPGVEGANEAGAKKRRRRRRGRGGAGGGSPGGDGTPQGKPQQPRPPKQNAAPGSPKNS